MKKLLLFFSITISIGLSAQTLISPFGASVSSNNYELSSSLGEIATLTSSNNNYTLTQGFHQSFSKFIGISELSEELNLALYPNPFNDQLNISMDPSLDISVISISDAQGKIVYSSYDIQSTMALDLSNLAKGMYVLSASSSKGFVAIYQLIKN